MNKRLTWIHNNFIDKNLYAPFTVERDVDYYDDLCKRYKLLIDNAKSAGADEDSIKIIDNYSKRVRDSIKEYFKGRIGASHVKIKNLIKDCCNHKLAVDDIFGSEAFFGSQDIELQFFRARVNKLGNPYPAKEMLHLPFSLRGRTSNNRFSIPGVPSLYLCNSSYACWLELGRPSEHDLMVSPVLVDGTQRILNLVVMNRDFHALNDYSADAVHTWLKLLVLMIATSYRVEEQDRIFHSEYIVSQGIMLACKELGIDGVAYYSKRVSDQIFTQATINLALIAPYKHNQEYSDICKHIKVDDSYNYMMFRQIMFDQGYEPYPLRCLLTGFTNAIGTYDRQIPYSRTEFCKFDKFLFGGWKNKDKIPFGNAIM